MFRLATAKGPSGELVALGHGAIVARSRDGTERWRYEAAAAMTALAATSEVIAAGDVDGRVFVLRPNGRLFASLAGHTRRVSGLAIRGDILFSGGWDGVVRAWSLDGLDDPATNPLVTKTALWGLSLQDALGR